VKTLARESNCHQDHLVLRSQGLEKIVEIGMWKDPVREGTGIGNQRNLVNALMTDQGIVIVTIKRTNIIESEIKIKIKIESMVVTVNVAETEHAIATEVVTVIVTMSETVVGTMIVLVIKRTEIMMTLIIKEGILVVNLLIV
jgi:hypothetical protein